MNTCACEACDRPVADAFVCGACAGQLERDLGDVPALVEDLDVALSRQAVFGDRAGGKSAEKPLPIDPRASEVGWVLRNTLSTWIRVLVEEGHAQAHSSGAETSGWSSGCDGLGAGSQPLTAAFMARWLLGHVEAIRHHQAGGEAADEIRSAIAHVRRVIDRPAQRWYAGACNCGTDLYVRPGATVIACRDCGTEHDVAKRRTELLDALEDRLATTVEISRAVRTIGQIEVTPSAIRGYAFRGRLEAKTVDRQGRPLYRMGDVLDLMAGEHARHAEVGAA